MFGFGSLAFFQSAHFHFIPFYSSTSNNHHVPSFPSCYVLILFGELNWSFVCMLGISVGFVLFKYQLFWAKSQASLKPGSASGHFTRSWWAAGKDRQSLRMLMSSSEKCGSRFVYHGAEWGGAASLARGNGTVSLGCSHPPCCNHSKRKR